MSVEAVEKTRASLFYLDGSRISPADVFNVFRGKGKVTPQIKQSDELLESKTNSYVENEAEFQLFISDRFSTAKR